jgi:hypothetical protein
MSTRWVEVDGLTNVRDLGGIPVAGGVTACGVVLRGETVALLSDLGAQRLRSLGVRHVLDLREPDERELDGYGPLSPAFDRSDILHEPVPLAGRPLDRDVALQGAADAVTIADRYVAYLDAGAFRLAEALARVAWTTSSSYVHCALGRDRTGVVCALLLALAGADDDAIVADHLLTGERIAAVAYRLAQRSTYAGLRDVDPTALAPNGDAMRLLLDHVRRQGGAQAWLLHYGVEAETLDLLVARLRGERVSTRHAG